MNPKHLISIIIIFILVFPFAGEILAYSDPTTIQAMKTDETSLEGDITSNSMIYVRISPEHVYHMVPSLILIYYDHAPTVNVTLSITVNTRGISHEVTRNYLIEALPAAWSPGWYFVPVPGLPAVGDPDGILDSSIESRVNFTVIDNGEVIYEGSYAIERLSEAIDNFPPLVYAFVEDALLDGDLVEETLGLSTWGWSVKEGDFVGVYVFAFDDTGLSEINLEYSVNGMDWNNVTLQDPGFLDPIREVVDQLRDSLSTINVDERYLPTISFELMFGIIPGQVKGSYVEFKASAVDVNGSTSISPHGLYYIDSEGDYDILIIDPWVGIWTLSRIIWDHRPVAAIDLGHGESDKGVSELLSSIDYVDWVVIQDNITLEELENVDILLIGQPLIPFSETEVQAISEWLSSGGKVLWVGGDSDYGSTSSEGPLVQEICNDLLSGINSHLRLETAAVYDNYHNIGGRPYRVLAEVNPDDLIGLGTQLLDAGISRPILFHGPTAVTWVDDNGVYHDITGTREDRLIRIVWSYNTSYIHDNNPPPPQVYEVGASDSFVLMAAELTPLGSVIIASGETPYGGFAPIMVNEYEGVPLDGMKFVENVMLWAAYNVISSFLLRPIISYDLPDWPISDLGKNSVSFALTGFARFHNWQYLAEVGDIFIVRPSPRVGEILDSTFNKVFEPDVIILSSLGLGINYTLDSIYSSSYDDSMGKEYEQYNLLNWDLKDIYYNESTVLETLINYIKDNNAGLIVTYSTLSDEILWLSCDEKVKVGSRGHVGYNTSDILSQKEYILVEGTVAALLGMPELAIWEMMRDGLAKGLCELGKSMAATPLGEILYAIGLLLGSTPMQAPNVPWDGELHLTREGARIGWDLPRDMTIAVEGSETVYTQVGWQLAFPRVLVQNMLNRAMIYADESGRLMSSLPVENNEMIYEAVSDSLSGKLGLLYDIIVNSSIGDWSINLEIDAGLFNDSVRGQRVSLNIDLQDVKEILINLKPIKIIALSEDGMAGITAFDKYWTTDGYRSVYFSFDVESATSSDAKKLLIEAVEWVANWEYKGPLDIIGDVLEVDRDTSQTFHNILESIGGEVILEKPIIMPEKGNAIIDLSVEQSKTYHIIVTHPTTDTVDITVQGAVILDIETENNNTHAIVISRSTSIEITVSPSSSRSLNPAYVTIVEEPSQASTYTTTTTTVTHTVTTTTTPESPSDTTTSSIQTTQSTHPITTTTSGGTTPTVKTSGTTTEHNGVKSSPLVITIVILILALAVIMLYKFKK